MEKSQYTVKKINSTEQDNFAQEDILGIHHVTAITSDPQRNIDFYTQILGLGLVKLTVNLLIPENSINYWMDRFKDKKIEFHGPSKRFENEQVITFHDPDGLELELVAHNSAENRTANIWKEGPIPIEHAIRGFYSVTLSEEGYERTAS